MTKYSSKLLAIIVALAIVVVAGYSPSVNAGDLPCVTYNNNRPGGSQPWPGYDAVEIRPNQKNPLIQIWYHKDGRWDGQDGKKSFLASSQQSLEEYCRNPIPSPGELLKRAAAEARCPDSSPDGAGQKILPKHEWRK
ncbi:MAG: hypothetical protein WAV73_03605 [Candidatus Moraniibacteriota bacterium]